MAMLTLQYDLFMHAFPFVLQFPEGREYFFSVFVPLEPGLMSDMSYMLSTFVLNELMNLSVHTENYQS